MEKKQMEELVAKYNEGVADPQEIKTIERLLEQGAIDLVQLHSLNRLDEQIVQMADPMPSLNLDDKFYSMLKHEKKKVVTQSTTVSWDWNSLFPRLALAATLLVGGFLGGYWMQSGGKSEVTQLTQEVSDLKEMMMLTLLEKESATDRLKAVGLTSELPVSEKITTALFQTLNNDENVNVRLAALDALRAYSKNSSVREQLIRAIAQQNDPLVQVALAELMASLQEKKSVKELKKLLENERTPHEVKTKIEQTINVLI